MIRLGLLYFYKNTALGNRRWAHLWDDEGNKEELLRFGRNIGLKPEWIQGPEQGIPTIPEFNWHFDVVESKHREALRKGAILTDEPKYLPIREGIPMKTCLACPDCDAQDVPEENNATVKSKNYFCKRTGEIRGYVHGKSGKTLMPKPSFCENVEPQEGVRV